MNARKRKWPQHLGAEYFGSWADGQRNSQGTFLYGSGAMYSVEWRDGENSACSMTHPVSTFADGIAGDRLSEPAILFCVGKRGRSQAPAAWSGFFSSLASWGVVSQ